MMEKHTFVNFRTSTSIGIASEILRLALARAVLFSEILIPIRCGWLGPIKSTFTYPKIIYVALDSPRLAQGRGIRFQIARSMAFLEQVSDAIRVHLRFLHKLKPRSPRGQEGLYFESPELFQRLQYKSFQLAIYRTVARAVRNFGPVTLCPEYKYLCQEKRVDLGLGADDWFVCLHVRTSEFYGDNAGHRNACFDNYRKTIDYIVGLGGKVIRMGDKGAGIVNFQQEGLIDYPNSALKSELMDLYLIKYCRFYIGTLSGILDTAYLFQTPTLCVNSLHFDLRSPNPCDRVLYKRIARKGSNQLLSFDQAMDEYENILSADWSLSYEFIENDAEELLVATQEFIEGLETPLQPSLRQQKARRKLIRNRLNYAAKNGGEFSMLSASIAFSRCHITNSSLDDWLLA
jgi:putative glycosyltransferase (TIGR04372 family)